MISLMSEQRIDALKNMIKSGEKIPASAKTYLDAKMMPPGPTADKKLYQAAFKGEKAAAVEIAHRLQHDTTPNLGQAVFFYTKAIAPLQPHETSDLSLYATAKAQEIFKEHALDQNSLLVRIAKRKLLHAHKPAEAPLFGG